MGMTDNEKVIKGLECCMSGQPDGLGCSRMPCPYNQFEDCEGILHRDALAMLKAQEPRVMTLDEIHRRMVVWLEYVDKPEVELAIGGSSARGEKCFITEYDMAIHLSDDAYNRRWRAWTAEPTDEQREAIPWEP